MPSSLGTGASARSSGTARPASVGWAAAGAAVASALMFFLLVVVPHGDQPPARLTVTAVEARGAVDDFTRLLNEGRVAAAYAMSDGSLQRRPEAIDGFAVNPLLGFDEEYRYARWTTLLGGERRLTSCAAERWIRLVDGTPKPADAQLLQCSGTYTNAFYAATGLAPAATAVTIAVGPGSQILLYKERVVGVDHTRVSLRFRRWLRAHHPELVGAIFTPGGTPVATPGSALLMLALAPAFAAAP